ncbi:hypothetical protein [Couchioplanes azureus]|uniref:hypothetical protein n=1 Tax=Couchioplanes caeruleus TaxID=56438 RepID=UPI00166FED62|nr:hypothetical protein [Couchioplanes caeruleus]GGQ84531.1 hypothetical protein GCM10010166_63400 [Couchioplanes caeruleus subsp. azureus]
MVEHVQVDRIGVQRRRLAMGALVYCVLVGTGIWVNSGGKLWPLPFFGVYVALSAAPLAFRGNAGFTVACSVLALIDLWLGLAGLFVLTWPPILPLLAAALTRPTFWRG